MFSLSLRKLENAILYVVIPQRDDTVKNAKRYQKLVELRSLQN
jgi:hypothetical protein